MNKISIVTAITLASIAFVSAEETGVRKPVQIKAPLIKNMIKNEGRDIQMPNLKTGDVAIDSQIKTLNDEMEAKIKAIRDEYVAKIKAIVGSRASTTPKMIPGERGEKKGFDEGKKLGVPFMMNASSTASGTPQRPPMLRPELRSENEGEQNKPNVGPRMMNFLRGMFGGNR